MEYSYAIYGFTVSCDFKIRPGVHILPSWPLLRMIQLRRQGSYSYATATRLIQTHQSIAIFSFNALSVIPLNPSPSF